MKKNRFSVEQIVSVLKKVELGVLVAEVIRKVGRVVSGWVRCTMLCTLWEGMFRDVVSWRQDEPLPHLLFQWHGASCSA